LATRSAQAAKEIKHLVEQATTKANEGKSIADEMIGGYGNLNSKVEETITLINDVTDASKEQETGIVQINDAINALDQSTQINAASASQINSLSAQVLTLSEDLLSIAKRAKYDTSKSNQVCDVDLVFKTAKLKNDHIVFKNTNFSKVGESANKTWTVTKETECDLGNWILQQERENQVFTQNSNWQDLKENHVKVHQCVQEYINENGKDEPNEELLLSSSKQVEEATFKVFKSLDQLKVDFCRVQHNASNVSQTAVEVAPTKTPSKPKKDVVPKTAAISQVTPKEDDKDDWESF
jgi:methyl-accepting chemotaxis protein